MICSADKKTELVFDESMSFNYGYTCWDCPYLDKYDTKDGKPWCKAWSRYINDPSYEGDRCSRRPANPGR